MTEKFLDWLVSLISDGDVHPFYVSPEWRHLSKQVLRDDHWDCQICKAQGQRTRAALVHHVKHVKTNPRLALERYYTDDSGEKHRNLLSVCRSCHENTCHPERMHRRDANPGFATAERWD